MACLTLFRRLELDDFQQIATTLRGLRGRVWLVGAAEEGPQRLHGETVGWALERAS